MKRIISLFLSFTLITQTILQAGALDDVLDGAMINVTKPQTYTIVDSKGKTVATKFYSGGLTFSFKTDVPPPIFKISPPSLEAGCNGLNIKGMFISLLGLDQLGSMLKNAGASLAWGVAIGLIYSLPGVASAFKMINQWAKDLQKLLANACQSGIAIGQYMASKFGIDKEGMERKIMNAIPDWAKCSQEGSNCVADALGLGDYFNKDGIFSFGADNGELSDKDKIDTINTLLRGLFEADYSLGGKVVYDILKQPGAATLRNSLTGIFGLNDPNETSFEHTKFYLEDGDVISGSGDVRIVGIETLISNLGTGTSSSDASSETTKERARMALWSYLLTYNFMGDVALSDTNSFIETALREYVKDSSKEEEALQELNRLKSMSPVPNITGPGAAIPEDTAAHAIANLLIYGSRESGISALSSPTFEIVKAEEEKSGDTAFTVLLSSDHSSGRNAIDISGYGGLELASLCAIHKKLNIPVGNACDDNGMGNMDFYVEDIDYFIKVIQNSPWKDKNQLTDILIQYNTQMAGIALLDAMYKNMELLTGLNKRFTRTGVSGSDDYHDSNVKGTAPNFQDQAADVELKYMQRISNVVEKAKTYIRENVGGGINTYKEVRSLFRAQELDNKQRALEVSKARSGS